jgi:hypothetical protein
MSSRNTQWPFAQFANPVEDFFFASRVVDGLASGAFDLADGVGEFRPLVHELDEFTIELVDLSPQFIECGIGAVRVGRRLFVHESSSELQGVGKEWVEKSEVECDRANTVR